MNVIFGVFGLFFATASMVVTGQKQSPTTHFLTTFTAADKSTIVQLPPSPCKPGEDLVTQQHVVSAASRSVGIDYDVDLKSGISRANNAKIVCRSGASQPHAQYPVLEVECVDTSQFVYFVKLRGRSSDKWFLVCKPPRAADTRALQ